MVYANYQGVVPTGVMRRMALGLAALGALVGIGVAAQSAVQAASAPVNYTNVAFTQQEIDDNWVVDRAVPSGGYGSVSFGGRDDVLEMNIDTTNRSTLGSFYYTEGLQRSLTDVAAVKADLYVDADWASLPVRAGLWGVGHDSTEAVSAYPIVEFTANNAGYTGWRVWDGVLGGWTNLPAVPYSLDAWNSLSVVYDADANQFSYYINGTLATSNTGGDSVDLGAVILNSYNYGPDGSSYSVHWSGFGYGDLFANPTTKEACKAGGWQSFGFANQGLCVQYVNTGKDSRL